MKLRELAQIVHEIQKSFCDSIGDYSLPVWAEAGYMQDNTVKGVLFLLDNPDESAGASHTAWVMDKINSGWTLGPVKDWEKKEHPALVPFDELPVYEQTKDYLFVQTVRSLEKFL